ncbi:MAG: TIGR03617 family F420-dependent LLM class oxidoreductase [Acidimicrobiia bacterium]
MLIDTHIGRVETAADEARAAEDAGYDGVFTGEMNGDPFLPLTMAVPATSGIQLGTSIAVAFARSPMTLAYTTWDLQRFSKGRLVVGLGSQVRAHIDRRFSMPWGRPAIQMRDYVMALRAIWQSWHDDTPLKFESEHYNHSLMTPLFVPPRNDFGIPAIYVAGVGDTMTRIAGEVADGFLCHGFTTAQWIRDRSLPALEEGRKRAGKTMDDFVVKAAIFLATGSDAEIETGVAEIRDRIAFYASTPAYKPVLDLHGWGEMGAELTTLSKAGRWAEMGRLITDEVVDAFAIVAPPAKVRDELYARYGGLLDRVSFIASGTVPTPDELRL